MSNITHTTLKNDKKEVTGYSIKVDGVEVGLASKGEKGVFNFKAHKDAAADSAGHKTMRDLKVAVGKVAVAAFVKKGVDALKAAAAAAKPPAAPKAPKTPPAADTTANAATAPAAKTDEDVDLD